MSGTDSDNSCSSPDLAYFTILPAITLRNYPNHRFYPIRRGTYPRIPIDCFMAYLGKDIDIALESSAQETVERWIQLCKRNHLRIMRLKHAFTRKQICTVSAENPFNDDRRPIIFVYVSAFDIKQFLAYVGRRDSRMYKYLCDMQPEKSKDTYTYLDITPCARNEKDDDESNALSIAAQAQNETTKFSYILKNNDAMMMIDDSDDVSSTSDNSWAATQQSTETSPLEFNYILKNNDAMMTFDDNYCTFFSLFIAKKQCPS